MPWVSSSALWIAGSDGRSVTVPLAPDRCVADIWSDFLAALAGLDVALDLWEKPQEVADTTPFSQNRDGCIFVAEQAQDLRRQPETHVFGHDLYFFDVREAVQSQVVHHVLDQNLRRIGGNHLNAGHGVWAQIW